MLILVAPYSAPHPSENAIQVRIQMYGKYIYHHCLMLGRVSCTLVDGKSALTALTQALDQLDALFASIDEAYRANLRAGKFETWDEKS